MSRRLWWWLVLLCALVVMVPRAMAQRPPETHPTDEHRDIVMTWDRSAMPGDIVLWSPRTVLGFSLDEDSNFGGLHATCRSSVSTESGRCPTDGIEVGLGPGSISLRFVERRSGLVTDLSLHGYLNRAFPGRRCSTDYWSNEQLNPWSGAVWMCASEWPVGTGISLTLPGHELERLVAGTWDATLLMDLRSEIGGGSIAEKKFSFDLTITDYDAVSIYLPEFQEATPTVGLNLSYDPIARTVGGRAHLDMCLYDGLGSQSEYLGVTVRDSGTRPPGPTGYSVWHTDGGGDEGQRVDYTITLDHNGARIPMRNGVEEQLRNIDTARLRLVMLPGMTQPVFCVPTPLTLDTPRVPIDEKRSGAYQGDLKVELRLPTSRP
ncbi:CfaE/CblD family pilus tip adhesin [Stenotrophomonas sp. Nf4]|uniref:CfaE/CblD family pilus tip adhesin n=2 Tax=unclassified Stenotrophomonas TaxID=196198 RepID=UPI000D164CAE|nr:CfaE/CblD family pilus tip adhesin [Stenotrophomonas sp. Nf4]PTA71635.1 pilin protein [Stenotrophomonas sp. Nf1]PTA81713.1 pilin protein [Stenotrophomonas sp. Nf4]